jgi:hypothetical protein
MIKRVMCVFLCVHADRKVRIQWSTAVSSALNDFSHRGFCDGLGICPGGWR